MIKNNYHTHVKYCNHAVGDVEDYVKAAIEFGFDELGMTDHAPILENFMSKNDYRRNWCEQNIKLDMIDVYLNDILEAKKKYGSKIKIYSGFETEYLDEQLSFYKELRSKVDYLNLGLHYITDEDGRILNTYSDINYNNVSRYADVAIEAMETGLFNTLVHPDLFMFSYKNINGERKFDDAAVLATRRICEAAIKNNVYVEVNANGLKNSEVYGSDDSNSWLYPYKEFWIIAKEYKDLKIIIGADAHEPTALANSNVEKVCSFAQEIGLPILEKMEINH